MQERIFLGTIGLQNHLSGGFVFGVVKRTARPANRHQKPRRRKRTHLRMGPLLLACGERQQEVDCRPNAAVIGRLKMPQVHIHPLPKIRQFGQRLNVVNAVVE